MFCDILSPKALYGFVVLQTQDVEDQFCEWLLPILEKTSDKDPVPLNPPPPPGDCRALMGEIARGAGFSFDPGGRRRAHFESAAPDKNCMGVFIVHVYFPYMQPRVSPNGPYHELATRTRGLITCQQVHGCAGEEQHAFYNHRMAAIRNGLQ